MWRDDFINQIGIIWASPYLKLAILRMTTAVRNWKENESKNVWVRIQNKLSNIGSFLTKTPKSGR